MIDTCSPIAWPLIILIAAATGVITYQLVYILECVVRMAMWLRRRL